MLVPTRLALLLSVSCALVAVPVALAAQSPGPISQQAYLKASNPGVLDQFSWSLAASGDTIVVGTPYEDGLGADSGVVYVFVRDTAGWSQQALLAPSNGEAGDHFGYAVSLSGDTLVAGAPGEDSGATGVDGDETDDGAPGSGAAYVFVRTGTSWTQQAYVKPSNTEGGEDFGEAVSLSGDTLVVGAPSENSGATGVNGDQSDDSVLWSGAAYVLVRDGTAWSQQAYLKASNTGYNDRFGLPVSVWGVTVVVGAVLEDSSATGIDGHQQDNRAESSGAVYAFVREGGAWSQQAYIKASNTGEQDHFGAGLALHGDRFVAGATREDSAATGVDGDQGDESAVNSGAAYSFVRHGRRWTQEAYLKASNTGASDSFGAVALSGDALLVGAVLEDSSATGVDGVQRDESSSGAGAAYLFLREAAGWVQAGYLKASNTGEGDLFGHELAISGETLVVGAYREDSAATGVDGDQLDDSTSQAGAAYVFALDVDPWADLGGGLAGVDGIPSLEGSGPLSAGSAGALALQAAAPVAPAMVFVSAVGAAAPFKCGTLMTVPVLFQLAWSTNGAGGSSLPWGSWPAGLSGLSLYFQAAILDAAAPCGVSISNALRADVP